MGEAAGEAGWEGASHYAYNALGALKVNAGVVLDDQRPKLAGGGTADAAVPANVGGQPVTLDAGGRVTSLRGTSFTRTKDGTLREADDPIPALAETYGVDAHGRRYSRMLGGVVQEYYVYEGVDRVATLGPNGSGTLGPLLESYLFDGIDHPLRIARPGASTSYDYYEVDLAGNVRGLRASGGASLGGYRYSAFGQTLEDTSLITQPLRWKGRWFSPVAGGTYDVRARQWSPELGVFLEIDEFGYHDPRSTLWGWGNQNPIAFSDPTGHLPWGPPNPPPVPPTPPTKPWCPADDPDRDQCRKDCDAAHDRDHAKCSDKKTPKERERCHSDANNDYADCLKGCPPL